MAGLRLIKEKNDEKIPKEVDKVCRLEAGCLQNGKIRRISSRTDSDKNSLDTRERIVMSI